MRKLFETHLGTVLGITVIVMFAYFVTPISNMFTEASNGIFSDFKKTYENYGAEDTEEYSITYVLNGGEFEGEVVRRYTGLSDVDLPIPNKDGYIFNGWYEDAEFDTDVITSITIGEKGNKTYIAKWEIITDDSES